MDNNNKISNDVVARRRRNIHSGSVAAAEHHQQPYQQYPSIDLLCLFDTDVEKHTPNQQIQSEHTRLNNINISRARQH